jgi:hypothetical protein
LAYDKSRGVSVVSARKQLFSAGKSIVTQGALETLGTAGVTPENLVDQHYHGEWGDTHPDDAEENDAAIENGKRILSAHVLPTGVRVWVLTEATSSDGTRPVTTVLLPDEY